MNDQNARPLTIEERFRAALAGAVLAMLSLGVLVLVFTPAAPAAPAYCSTVGDGIDEASLKADIDERMTEIWRYSPEMPVDRLTIQLDLMARCAA